MGDAAFTALTTQRLVLRRFRPEDLDAFVAYRSDPETARYQSWEAPYRPSQGRQFPQELEAIDPDTPGEWFQFAVALRHTDRLIGDCGAHVQAEDSRQAEIGFPLAPPHQGHGYATEAVRRLLHHLLVERGKHRVRVTCDDRNPSSAAMMERVVPILGQVKLQALTPVQLNHLYAHLLERGRRKTISSGQSGLAPKTVCTST